jgi:hypothetical protein
MVLVATAVATWTISRGYKWSEKGVRYFVLCSNHFQSLVNDPGEDFLLLEGYHRVEFADRNGLDWIPFNFYNPWRDGVLMLEDELRTMKQIRNFAEVNRLNDGACAVSPLKHAGDLHILLSLIKGWEFYKDDKEKFLRDTLVPNFSKGVLNKFYTLAKFLIDPMHRPSLGVLTNWYLSGDGSRFLRGHLDSSEWKELREEERVKVLTHYSTHYLTYVLRYIIIYPSKETGVCLSCYTISGPLQSHGESRARPPTHLVSTNSKQ